MDQLGHFTQTYKSTYTHTPVQILKGFAQLICINKMENNFQNFNSQHLAHLALEAQL